MAPSHTRSSRGGDPFDDPEYSYLKPSAPVPRYLEEDEFAPSGLPRDPDANHRHQAPRNNQDDYHHRGPYDALGVGDSGSRRHDHGRKRDTNRDEPSRDDERGRTHKPHMRRRISRSADVGERGRDHDKSYWDESERRPRHRSEQRRRDDWDHDHHHNSPRHRSSRHPPPSAMPRNLGGVSDPPHAPSRRHSRFDDGDNDSRDSPNIGSRHRRRNSGFEDDHRRSHYHSHDDDDSDDSEFHRPRHRHTSYDDEDEDFDRPRRRHSHNHHQGDDRRRRSHHANDYNDDDEDDVDHRRARRRHTHPRSSSADGYRSRRERHATDERGRPRQQGRDHADGNDNQKERGSSRARSMLGKVLWGAAIQAGLGAAMDMRQKPGPWMGEKGARVASAAVTSGLVDSFFHNKKPERTGGLRHQAAKAGFSEALGMAASRATKA